ncbi:DUF4153 domain-containing protein [Nonomuraea endophytica]|uniref:Signal transduction histidine-protein kinase/phosphatase MprB n=1 Tax=Nonomuraea endophytica TaxID=714136 RepID=A0A7W7ZVK2_9ACTN|nr:DUF4153 domain-containing protein [Nonomuraea endophytica]MBB5074580.1 signal transduction histidine kinase [Nonomuraea endophytica]
MRPLDFLGRIKVKLGLVIVLAVGVAFVVNEVGINSGYSRDVRIAVAAVLALIMVQWLARGMTKPLREMASAAQTIAKGSYTLRVRATSRDEVGELARAFNAMAADLAEVDRQRRELIANVSHELRTPITGLRAVLENVVDGVSTPDPVTMSTALAQTERLGRLVTQLLDLSRLDSGARLIEPEAIELGPLLEQALREAGLAREDVRLEGRIPPGLVVRADPDLLAQVLANLLDNAVRHSPPGALVTIAGAGQGAGVRITVADQGPGIPAEARSRVFERFSRLDSGRAADSGGSGLGLAIVKEIVELHGGSIHIGDGTGCRMVVDLPGRTTMAETSVETGEERPLERALPEPAHPTPEEAVPATEQAPAAATAAVTAEATAEATAEDPPVSQDEPTVAAGDVPAESKDSVAAKVTVGASEGVVAAEAVAVTRTGPITVPVESAPTRPVPVGAGAAVRSGPGEGAGGSPGAAGGQRQPGNWLGRLLWGIFLGLLAGFLVGLFAAVVMGVAFGGVAALVTLILATAAGGAVGSVVAADTAARQPYKQPRPPQPLAPGAYGPPPPPYQPPPLLPKPELPETPRWLLPAAAGAGVFAAVALPDAQSGLGLVLVALVLGAAALPAVLRRATPWTLAFGLTGYWLISTAVIRDADWLVLLMVTAGAGLIALAVSGAGTGWLGVIRGGMSVVLALGPVPWLLSGPLKGLVARRRIMPTLAGVGIAVVLVAVFGLLFASADRVFARYLERLTATPDWMESLPSRIVLFAVFGALLSALVLVALRPVRDPVGPGVKVTVARSVWLVPLTALNLLFGAFVAVQIRFLFGGAATVLNTEGLTYAEYAREGFFQLVLVSMIVLGIVAVVGGVLRTGRRERWVLAGQLGVLCALTLVILASALHRIDLYTEVYGLSRLRISVQATVWWLGVVFALVLLAGAVRLAGRGSGWLPRTIVLVTALGLGTFAMVNPDLRVAETQVAVRGVAQMDSDYLGDLGAEAVPALVRLPEPQRSCVLFNVVKANGLDRPDPWNGWNLARSQARELLAKQPVNVRANCVPGTRGS